MDNYPELPRIRRIVADISERFLQLSDPDDPCVNRDIGRTTLHLRKE